MLRSALVLPNLGSLPTLVYETTMETDKDFVGRSVAAYEATQIHTMKL